MTVRVREAATDDLAAILAHGDAMYAESAWTHMRYDPRQYGEFVVSLMADRDHAVLVAEDDGEVVGVLLCGVANSFFGPDLMAYEFLWYVTPAHRGGGAGLKLLHAYRDWAEEQGALRIQAGNSAGMPDEIYTRVLAHAGFQRAGSLMYLNL